MGVRKQYEALTKAIELFESDVANLAMRDKLLDGLKDDYDKMLKKAKKAFDDGAGANELKQYSAAMKESERKYKAWKKDRYDQGQIMVERHTDIVDRMEELGHALKDKAKTEYEHLEKHRKRITDAQARVHSMIEKKLDAEEAKYEKEEKQRKADAKAKQDADPSTASASAKKMNLQEMIGFKRDARREELWQAVKYNSAETKAIEAAQKRIDVYEKIRDKKLEKYRNIVDAMQKFHGDYGAEAVAKLAGNSWDSA